MTKGMFADRTKLLRGTTNTVAKLQRQKVSARNESVMESPAALQNPLWVRFYSDGLVVMMFMGWCSKFKLYCFKCHSTF